MANEFIARKGLVSSGSVNVSGSVTASFFKGDGSQLTNLPAATVLSSSVSIDTYTFTGDGSTKNYVLSQSYDVSSLFVSLAGLSQTNIQDYTLTGATLSFVSAPPASSNILVKALMNVTQNMTGSFSGSFFGILASASYATTASYAANAGGLAGVISSSTQFKTLTDPFTGSFTGSHTGTFPYSGLTGTPTLVSASSQIDYNSIQNKLSGVVSSSVQVQPLLPGGTVSSSAQYSGWVTSSAQINTGSFSGSITTASYVLPSGLPAGTVSSSAQVVWSSVNYNTGIVSSSTQVQPLLPAGTISSSTQFKTLTDPFTGSFTGSHTGTFPYSGITGLPTLVSASSQIDYNSIQNKLSGVVSSSAQVQPLLPGGTVSSSAQYPGWVTASSQIDYNSITNKLSGVISSSAQFNALTGTSASFAATASYVNTLLQNVSASGNIEAGVNLVSNFSSGDEGGQLELARSQTNTSISGSVVIDVFQNRVRIFEKNSPNRGGYWDVTGLAAGVGTNLAGGGGTVTSITAGNGLTGGTITGTGTITIDTGSTHFSSGVVKVLPAGTVSSSTQQVVSTYTNATDNYVLTSTGTGGINGESALLFDGAVLSVTTNNAKYFQGGDDAALYDVNVANTIGIYGVQDSTVGAIKLGSGGKTIYSNATGIGIGTISPAAFLHVQGNVSASSYTSSIVNAIGFVGTASYAANADLLDGLNSTVFATTGSNTFVGNQIVSGSSTVSNTGNFQVNITGTTPTAYTQLYFNGTGRAYGIGVGNASETTYGIANEFFLFDHSAAAVRLAVDTSGRVGIGTSAPAAQLQVQGNVSASSFTGSLAYSSLTGVPGGLVSSSAQYPGWVTSSTQIVWSSVNYNTGIVSSSTQVQPLLPAGTVSSSTQINTGSFSGSITTASYINPSGLPAGTLSSSTQVVWSSVNYNTGIVSSSAQVQPLLPGGTVSSSAQYPGWVTSSVQINTGSFSGSITTASFATTASAATSITFTPATASFALTASYVASAGAAAGTISSSAQFKTLTDPFTGSFTGSFTGNGSGLTNIPIAVQTDNYTFVGDGSTKNYILSQSYDTTSVDIYVAGMAYTNITDYTITAQTASFVSAPPNGSNILIKALLNKTNATGSFSGSFMGTLSGVSSSNNILPTLDNSYNLGSPTNRWANLYTGDLVLSNEGSQGNSVDGTTGNWTIQEGEEELFILNNKTGKKYKFMLVEIK